MEKHLLHIQAVYNFKLRRLIMKKRFLYCLLAFVMVLQVAPIHSLATNSYIKSENMLIQEIENKILHK